MYYYQKLIGCYVENGAEAILLVVNILPWRW